MITFILILLILITLIFLLNLFHKKYYDNFENHNIFKS